MTLDGCKERCGSRKAEKLLVRPKHSLSKPISEPSANCSGTAEVHLHQYKLTAIQAEQESLQHLNGSNLSHLIPKETAEPGPS